MQSIWGFVTDFGDTAVTTPLAVLMVGFLLAVRQPHLAIGWGLAAVGCAGAIAALKLVLFACGHVPGSGGLASPSGHTALSVTVYGGFAAVIGTALARPARGVLIVGTAMLTIGIAASRVILCCHSLIEVAVGLVVGAAALGAILAIVARHRPARLPVAWLAAAALIIAMLFHGVRWPAEQAIQRFAALIDFVRPWCS